MKTGRGIICGFLHWGLFKGFVLCGCVICPWHGFHGGLTIQEIEGILERCKAILIHAVDLLMCYHNLLFVYQVAY
jgi:hypothetical protein